MKNEIPKRTSRKIGTMDIILVIIGITLVIFTVVMLFIFTKYGAIPDTLCTCVFTALGSECGIMGWIKTNKEKYRNNSDDDKEG